MFIELNKPTKQYRLKLGNMSIVKNMNTYIHLYLSIKGSISTLNKRTYAPIAVDRFFSLTKHCSACHNIKDMHISDRFYICECGNIMERDYNIALNILNKGLSPVPMDDREFKFAETMAITLKMLGYLDNISHVKANLVYETGSLTALM